MNAETAGEFDPTSVTRPDDHLLHYYLLVAGLTLVGFPFVFPALYFKFKTLRYVFDDKGVSMSYGLLFRREIYLTYRRIQDIHVTRDLFHRWLGLAKVSVQTASCSAGAEMTIEGIRDPEALRDFLYSQMRGARGETEPADETAAQTSPDEADEQSATTPADTASVDRDAESLRLLQEIRDEIRRLRTGADTTEVEPDLSSNHTTDAATETEPDA